MRLEHLLGHVRRLGTVAGPDARGEYRAEVHGQGLCWRECRPGEVSGLRWVLPGGEPSLLCDPVAHGLRACLYSSREQPAGDRLVNVTYTLDQRLRECVETTVRPRGGSFTLAEDDGEGFVLAREFARWESDAFLDWLQDHRPWAFNGRGGCS